MCCQCDASTDETRLFSSLFDPNSYSRHVRPVVDHRKPVIVDVRLSLVEIVGLDETNGRLTLKLHLNLVPHTYHRHRSSVNFGGDIFCRKIYVWKIYKMPEFYTIFARKIFFPIFFWGGTCPSCPLGSTPMIHTDASTESNKIFETFGT